MIKQFSNLFLYRHIQFRQVRYWCAIEIDRWWLDEGRKVSMQTVRALRAYKPRWQTGKRSQRSAVPTPPPVVSQGFRSKKNIVTVQTNRAMVAVAIE